MNKISKKISFGLILVLVVFTSIYGVTNTKSIAPPSNGYTITCYGYVKDYNTNTGIYGVSVVLRDTLYGITKTVTTSSTGYYSVSITVPSYLRFTLTVSKSGYITQSKSFTRTGSYRSDFLFCKTGTHIVTCTGYVLDGHYGFVLSGAII
ncbi:MAG: carboxypeptidase-like regulatory domain-containing protein, partial [Candidatus Thorarchaeota archaeon]